MAWPPDISVPRAILFALGVTVVVAVVVAASTSATSFSLYNTGWDGSADLRAITTDAGATYRVGESTQAYTQVTPNQTLAVVLAPGQPYSDPEVLRLRTFLENGGTLLVAGDVGTVPNELLAALGSQARLDGAILRDERNHFRGPALPIADNVTNSSVTMGIDRLTLNHATAVHPNGATVLVRTSPFAYLDQNGDGDLDDAEQLQSWPVVTRESIGRGSLLVVGDPSVFINVMLDQPENREWFVTLATAHETVILDTSHSAAVPPLAAVVLALRESILLQILTVLAGVALAIAGSHPRLREAIREWWREDRVEPSLTHSELEHTVRERHPDWEPTRVQRVVEGVMRQRRQEGDDD